MSITKETIKGFFNPRTSEDTFKGLGIAMGMDGTIADKIHSDLQEFLEAGGRNYFIRKAPVFQRIEFGGERQFAEVEGQFHLERSTDGLIVSPHTVTDQYAPLSLMDVAEEVAPWVQAGWATPDAVFSARNGALEVLVLRLDAGGQITDGDFYVHYIVIQNPHGTGGKAKGKIISFRVVCANTFAAAVSAASDFTITHRVASGDHEKQQEIMVQRTKDAVAAWSQVQEHISELSKRINTWADAAVTFEQAATLTDDLLQIADVEDASKRKQNNRQAVLDAFAMPQFGTFGKTLNDWVNGVTFVNSSPLAPSVKASKVSAIDRAVRNVDPNGTGFKLEQRAHKVAAAFLAS